MGMKVLDGRRAAGWALLSLMTACSAEPNIPPLRTRPVVEVVRPRPVNEARVITASGRFARDHEIRLSFRIPGVITSLRVNEGDLVQAGQVLATLDDTGVSAAALQAEVQQTQAQRELTRDRALFEKGFVSRARLEDRESALRAATARTRAAGFDRRWASLRSPASGVVLARVAAAGEVVQPGQTVLRIADEASPMLFRASVPDRDANKVTPDQEAQITFTDGRASVRGRVLRIGRLADDQTGSVTVDLQVPAADGVRSGEVATALIQLTLSGGGGLARIPAEAILTVHGTRATVLVVEAGKARNRSIVFSGFDGDDAVVAGLAADLPVITAGGAYAEDGELVRVVGARDSGTDGHLTSR